MMILFDLTKAVVSGPNSESINEVRWSGNQCVVNGDKSGPIKEVTLKGVSAAEVKAKREAIIGSSKADLFALLKSTPEYKIGAQYSSTFAYAEVCLS